MPKNSSTNSPLLPPGCCTFRPPRRLDDVGELSELCKALGDPTRLQMLQLLAMATRPLCACELESQFDLSQPTISHHLRILREAGVVDTSRRGTWVFYALRRDVLTKVRRLASLLRPQDDSATSAGQADAEKSHE